MAAAKTLYILRHAKAQSSAGLSDKDRPLAPKGVEDALILGRTMAAKDYVPEKVLCSAAKRTRQTCEQVLGSFPGLEAEYSDALYSASRGEWLAVIQDMDDKYNSLLLVGHNPAIHGIAALLAQEERPAHMDRLSVGYATASLSVLRCPIKSWSDIQPAANPLIDFMDPTDYNAPARPTRWM